MRRLASTPAIAVALVLASLPLVAGAARAAPKETVIYRFKGGVDGSSPQAGVIFDAKGALYGTTNQGGRQGGGTVFRLNPPAPPKVLWTKTILHNFAGGTDGTVADSPLVFDAGGALYGTTLTGGSGNGGIVFKLTPPPAGKTLWSESVLWSFSGGADGGGPMAGVMVDSAGAVYGTTLHGGSGNFGVVFRLTPAAGGALPWNEKILHDFSGKADGALPYAGLIADAGGNLYGTAAFGGSVNEGVVFRITPPAAGKTLWGYKVLHNFIGITNPKVDADGAEPFGSLLMDSQGNLYGTTLVGGGYGNGNIGEVFRLSPPAGGTGTWAITELWDFGALNDGQAPQAALVGASNGTLYGTTTGGGTANGGTVFALAPPAAGSTLWTETVLHSFSYSAGDGFGPNTTLVRDAQGALYGTTPLAGSTFGNVYRITP